MDEKIYAEELGVTLTQGEEIDGATVKELSDGKGDDNE